MSLTKEQQMKLRVLYTKLCTVAEMAESLSTDKQTILQALSDMRLKPIFEHTKPQISEFATKVHIPQEKQKKSSKGAFTPEVKKEILRLNSMSIPVKDIAEKLGFTNKQVSSQLYIMKGEKMKADTLAEPKVIVAAPPCETPIVSVPLVYTQSTFKVPSCILKMAEQRLSTLTNKIIAIEKERDELAEFIGMATKTEPAPAATDTSSSTTIQQQYKSNEEDCQDDSCT